MRFDFKVYATCQGSFFTLLHAIQWHHTSKEMGFKSRICLVRSKVFFPNQSSFVLFNKFIKINLDFIYLMIIKNNITKK